MQSDTYRDGEAVSKAPLCTCPSQYNLRTTDTYGSTTMCIITRNTCSATLREIWTVTIAAGVPVTHSPQGSPNLFFLGSNRYTREAFLP